jgi:hypothetical protein
MGVSQATLATPDNRNRSQSVWHHLATREARPARAQPQGGLSGQKVPGYSERTMAARNLDCPLSSQRKHAEVERAMQSGSCAVCLGVLPC